nr:tetratricopeptide repeat protein [Nostocaceae cyanobacterium]
GVTLRRLGRTKEAVESYEKAIAADPNNYEAWDNQGYALAKLGKYSEALIKIDRSLQIKPDHANGIYNKGYCYACQGKTTLAVDHISQAIKLNPARFLPLAKTDKDLDSLRKNKRFQAILAKQKIT